MMPLKYPLDKMRVLDCWYVPVFSEVDRFIISAYGKRHGKKFISRTTKKPADGSALIWRVK